MIPIIRPDLRLEEVTKDLQEIFESGVLTTGPFVQQFEAQVAEIVGVDFAVATTSATTALHLALVAAGVGPGDEVLVSDFTFPASGNVIAQIGARPVLVDNTADSFVLDVELAARLVTDRTRAIMAVHPFGQPAPLNALNELATKHQLILIEDAACALGSGINENPCGSWSTAGCFSFHPRKVVTTGEGGMITTNDSELAARLRLLRSHGGQSASVGMTFVENGFNYRLSEVSSALGLAQLRRLDEILLDRHRSAERYRELLTGIPGIKVPWESAGQRWNFQSMVVWIEEEEVSRDNIILRLRERGIETTLGTYAIHAHPAFAGYGYKPGQLPHSYGAQQRSLTLPLPPQMSDQEIEYVVSSLVEEVARQ